VVKLDGTPRLKYKIEPIDLANMHQNGGRSLEGESLFPLLTQRPDFLKEVRKAACSMGSK
jgi:hypothetical protein